MPQTDCSACPLRAQPLFTPFTPAELAFMRRFKTGEVVVPRGAQVLNQGESSPRLFTVHSGMGTRSVLLEDGRRLAAVGLAREGAVPLPFRQQELADALGLSLVHTNKTVARLRRDGLAFWQDGRLSIPDKDALARVAGVQDQREDRRPIL